VHISVTHIAVANADVIAVATTISVRDDVTVLCNDDDD
jgi:hypothetical protein